METRSKNSSMMSIAGWVVFLAIGFVSYNVLSGVYDLHAVVSFIGALVAATVASAIGVFLVAAIKSLAGRN